MKKRSNTTKYNNVYFKDCPCCGKEPIVKETSYAHSNYDCDSYYFVKCGNCGLEMKSDSTYYQSDVVCKIRLKDLANRWNKRSTNNKIRSTFVEPICIIDDIGIFGIASKDSWECEEHLISKTDRNEILEKNPYFHRVSDTLWINLLYVNLVTRENGFFNIYFSGCGTVKYVTHIDCACLDELQEKRNLQIFEGRLNFIDLDGMWEIDSIDGTHFVQIQKITLSDPFSGYIKIHIETEERILLNDMSLSDFLSNIEAGVINKIII